MFEKKKNQTKKKKEIEQSMCTYRHVQRDMPFYQHFYDLLYAFSFKV